MSAKRTTFDYGEFVAFDEAEGYKKLGGLRTNGYNKKTRWTLKTLPWPSVRPEQSAQFAKNTRSLTDSSFEHFGGLREQPPFFCRGFC